MKMRCFGCDIEKDIDIKEASPFAEEDGLTDKPIPPLQVLDCQGPSIPNDHHNYDEYEFRMVVICHTCFHKLSPDMWISENCWKQINPTIPYEKLPMYIEGLYDITLLEPLS